MARSDGGTVAARDDVVPGSLQASPARRRRDSPGSLSVAATLLRPPPTAKFGVDVL